MDRLTLTQDQRKLLQMLLYAKEKESQLTLAKQALEEPIYKEESSYLEKRASLYDFVYWETLGKLTGENVESYIKYAGEAMEAVEERALYYSQLDRDRQFEEVEEASR
jgi:hypothetical protein